MREDWIEAIKTIVDESRIRLQEPMSRHTTFRIGGMAEIFLMPTIKEAVDVITLCRAKKIPYTIIGNGSNLLVGDKGIPGVVIEFGANASSVEVKENMIHAEAGALLSKVAHKALEASLGGMEFAAGIPGSIGGAVVMNAGAYGGEMKDILVSADLLTKDGEVVEVPVEEISLSYRHSRVMETGEVVLGVTLKLVSGEKEKIEAVMQELRQKRQEKQPLEFPSAGSTFKRTGRLFCRKADYGCRVKRLSCGRCPGIRETLWFCYKPWAGNCSRSGRVDAQGAGKSRTGVSGKTGAGSKKVRRIFMKLVILTGMSGAGKEYST